MYLKQGYLKSIAKIYIQFKGFLKTNIEKSFDLIQIKSIQKEIEMIEDDQNVKENNDNCLFNCFQKKKKKLETSHYFSLHLNELVCSLNEIKKGIKKIYTDEIFKEEFNNLRKESLEGYLNSVFNNQKVIVKLKDEVDNYAEYLNLNILIEKQENKLKVQKKKLLDLEEYKTQNECIICMENERKVLFYPCLHFICCETCAFTKSINDCPTCHKEIEKREYILS
jgi:hypothetical protein